MKTTKLSFAIFVLLLSLPLFSEGAKTTPDYKTLLSSGTDQERMEALDHFAKEKDKSQIPAIIEVLREADSVRLAQKAAITLGLLGEKGDSTKALKNKIQSDENAEVVYACILAIFNIHKGDKADARDADAVEALQYANENRRQDPFVADILDKLKSRYQVEKATQS